MDIEKTIELRQELRTDENDAATAYVRFTGSIDAMGASNISYTITYGQEQVFVDHTKDFRKALQAFQNRVWNETDEFLEQRNTGESEAPAEGETE